MQIRPLTAERWPDLERLFGRRGACGGCWCMYWRLPGSLFDNLKGEGTRSALQSIVEAGEEPGLLAYEIAASNQQEDRFQDSSSDPKFLHSEPVGWVALAPRQTYPRLARSRILKPVDEQPVWSISCFFVAKGWRRQGVSLALLQGAVDYAFAHGAQIVEGYPIETPRGGDRQPDPFVYTGLASIFVRAGFVEVARRSPTRPIMRISRKT